MSTLSVHVVYEHCGDLKPFGCAYIRDLLPLGHPTNRDSIALTSGADYAPADVVVVERTFKPGATVFDAEEFVARVQRDNVRLAYTLDDNLLDAPQIPRTTRTVVRFFCHEADAIIVSTPALAERVARLGRRVLVLPNAIDERLFFPGAPAGDAGASPSNRLRIGFMGTWTHERDLMMVVQPLREVLRAHRDTVEFQIVGGAADPGLLAVFGDLPVRTLPVPAEDVEYPAFVRWMKAHVRWDIGIAPLEDTHFTRSKSDIKFLDYAALGIPGLFSDVPAYAGTVRHRENGWLVANDPAEWANGLSLLIEDSPLRGGLAENARAYVAAERTLERRAADWRVALASLV